MLFPPTRSPNSYHPWNLLGWQHTAMQQSLTPWDLCHSQPDSHPSVQRIASIYRKYILQVIKLAVKLRLWLLKTFKLKPNWSKVVVFFSYIYLELALKHLNKTVSKVQYVLCNREICRIWVLFSTCLHVFSDLKKEQKVLKNDLFMMSFFHNRNKLILQMLEAKN